MEVGNNSSNPENTQSQTNPTEPGRYDLPDGRTLIIQSDGSHITVDTRDGQGNQGRSVQGNLIKRRVITGSVMGNVIGASGHSTPRGAEARTGNDYARGSILYNLLDGREAKYEGGVKYIKVEGRWEINPDQTTRDW